VIRQLRPHLEEAGFVQQVQRQMKNHGYQLIFIEENGLLKAAAGYRIAEFLAWGKTLYVDDLITDEAERGRGFGGALLQWLEAKAKESGCVELHLDSGVHRFAAHRLYMLHQMVISSHHFSKKIV
jgi:GNAT superfamily N-acetyltransferase